MDTSHEQMAAEASSLFPISCAGEVWIKGSCSPWEQGSKAAGLLLQPGGTLGVG